MNKKIPIIIAGFVAATSVVVYKVNAPVVTPCDTAVRIEASSTRVIDKDCI
jgi:hypothetical protein